MRIVWDGVISFLISAAIMLPLAVLRQWLQRIYHQKR